MCIKGAYTECVYSFCPQEYIPLVSVQNYVLRSVPHIQSLYLHLGEVPSYYCCSQYNLGVISDKVGLSLVAAPHVP